MIFKTRGNLLQTVLLGLSFIFIVFIVFELNRPFELILAVNRDKQSHNDFPGDTASLVETKSLADYRQIIDRPLFNEDRRPFAGSQAEKNQGTRRSGKMGTTDIEDAFLLSAVIITPAERFALIQSRRTRDLHKLKPGETLDGWTITDIQANSVSLEKGGRIGVLDLEVKINETQAGGRDKVRSVEAVAEADPGDSIKSPGKVVEKKAASGAGGFDVLRGN